MQRGGACSSQLVQTPLSSTQELTENTEMALTMTQFLPMCT